MKNKFTYGIELEGIFTPSFVESLNKHNLVGECKTDGSVRSERILNSYDLESEYMYKNNDDISCEISSSILNFTELNKFLSITKKFYEKGYYFDNSCGIHIHIKGNDQKMNELVTTEFFWKVEKYIKKTYKELAFRFTGPCSFFCKENSKNFSNIFGDIKSHDKYRALRNHPQGTLEFRIFSPQDIKFKEHILDLIKYIDNYEYNGKIKIKTEKDIKLKMNSSEILKIISGGSRGAEVKKLLLVENYNNYNVSNLINTFRSINCNREINGDIIISKYEVK